MDMGKSEGRPRVWDGREVTWDIRIPPAIIPLFPVMSTATIVFFFSVVCLVAGGSNCTLTENLVAEPDLLVWLPSDGIRMYTLYTEGQRWLQYQRSEGFVDDHGTFFIQPRHPCRENWEATEVTWTQYGNLRHFMDHCRYYY